MELTIVRWTDELNALTQLRPGWNGYTAPVPSEEALIAAREFLSVALRAGDEPTRLAASVVGGVGVTWRKGDRKVYVEFLNSGGIHALFADDGTFQMDTSQVESTPNGFQELRARMREYLDG